MRVTARLGARVRHDVLSAARRLGVGVLRHVTAAAATGREDVGLQGWRFERNGRDLRGAGADVTWSAVRLGTCMGSKRRRRGVEEE